MKTLRSLTFALVLALIAPSGASAVEPSEGGPQDAVVVAVIDNGFNPYHFDYRGSHMPQALNADANDDIPLTQPPHAWLSGFPDPSSFASYQPLELTLPTTSNSRGANLFTGDAAAWSAVKHSAPGAVNLYWLPGTKAVAALEFGTSGTPFYGDFEAHGTGTTSVSVGNLHGTCPECLLVFIGYQGSAGAQQALDWAHAQPWIDVVSNSWGINTMSPVTSAISSALGSRDPGVTFRDQIYLGPVEGQRAASERGQTITFSAGNGIENGFVTPHTTYTSSIKGPDWVVTVGAIDSIAPHPSYLGAGKPVDVAGVGDSYPSAYGSTTIGGSRNTFSGTSNASPTVAGTYARALAIARADLAGPSRIQSGGVVATGAPYACAAARPDCELGDGILTAEELRTRLLHAPARTNGGTSVGGLASSGSTTSVEEALLQQGHGTFLARLKKDTAAWLAEFDLVLAPLEGRAPAQARTQAERDFMLVDSYCRQQIWGGWAGGYYAQGAPLPGPDAAFPVRSALEAACAWL